MTRQRTRGDIVGWTAAICGALGLVTGLVIGLVAYLPTAWASAFEIGIPATMVGALLGLAIVGVRGLVRWLRSRSA